MHKFPKIKSWKHVCKAVDARAGLVDDGPCLGRVTYEGTVKLHGTNCGVVCTAAGLVPQSRNRALTVDSDNYGFAAFVAEHRDPIRLIEARLRRGDDRPLVVYGELVGQGIQNGVAITKLERRQWVIFAAAFVDGSELHFLERRPDVPGDLAPTFASVLDVEDVRYELTVDFRDPLSRCAAYNTSAELVTAVDQRCPWAARYDLDGAGEGVVWIPTGEHRNDLNLWWKHKGGSHKNAPKVIRTVDVEHLGRVQAAAARCLEGRLEQALEYLEEMRLPLDTTSIPEFLKRIGGEVKTECDLELEEAGLSWKQVSKQVNAMAVAWFKERI